MRVGAIVVGAAAGVTNPFVGTGIATAMVTGNLATAVTANIGDAAAVACPYVQLLGRCVIGYSGVAAHAARRYHVTWRVLLDHEDHPRV